MRWMHPKYIAQSTPVNSNDYVLVEQDQTPITATPAMDFQDIFGNAVGNLTLLQIDEFFNKLCNFEYLKEQCKNFTLASGSNIFAPWTSNLIVAQVSLRDTLLNYGVPYSQRQLDVTVRPYDLIVPRANHSFALQHIADAAQTQAAKDVGMTTRNGAHAMYAIGGLYPLWSRDNTHRRPPISMYANVVMRLSRNMADVVLGQRPYYLMNVNLYSRLVSTDWNGVAVPNLPQQDEIMIRTRLEPFLINWRILDTLAPTPPQFWTMVMYLTGDPDWQNRYVLVDIGNSLPAGWGLQPFPMVAIPPYPAVDALLTYLYSMMHIDDFMLATYMYPNNRLTVNYARNDRLGFADDPKGIGFSIPVYDFFDHLDSMQAGDYSLNGGLRVAFQALKYRAFNFQMWLLNRLSHQFVSYQCGGYGPFSALMNAVSIYGNPGYADFITKGEFFMRPVFEAPNVRHRTIVPWEVMKQFNGTVINKLSIINCAMSQFPGEANSTYYTVGDSLVEAIAPGDVDSKLPCWLIVAGPQEGFVYRDVNDNQYTYFGNGLFPGSFSCIVTTTKDRVTYGLLHTNVMSLTQVNYVSSNTPGLANPRSKTVVQKKF